MIITTARPDPSWLATVQSRRAILWLPAGFPTYGKTWPNGPVNFLEELLSRPWAAVYCEATKLGIEEAVSVPRADRLNVRVYDNEPPAEVPAGNRLPIYVLSGSSQSNTILRKFANYQKMRLAPAVDLVVVVGDGSNADWDGLVEAATLSDSFRQVVIITPTGVTLTHSDLTLNSNRTIVHWGANALDLLQAIGERPGATPRIQILMRAQSGLTTVDLSDCVDPGLPVTSRFGMLSDVTILDQKPLEEADIAGFFRDPTSNWHAYRAGLPYPRHRDILNDLRRHLKRLGSAGPQSSFTGWITAENGSGATTALRQVCFDLARDGVPVLVARPDADSFDLQQLKVFLSLASDRATATSDQLFGTPWVVAFDAAHVQNHWGFLVGLCNALKTDHRSVVILAIRPGDLGGAINRTEARGDNRKLGQVLSNSISLADGVDLGRHLKQFVVKAGRYGKGDWERFIEGTLLPTHGRRSLFWLGLRFWLLDSWEIGESFRGWLSRKYRDEARTPERRVSLLETAVLGKYRLSLPDILLEPGSRDAARVFSSEASHVLGIIHIRDGAISRYTFAHPLIAEEILRIASEDQPSLAAVGMSACLNVFDLELHLLGRLVKRHEAGAPACVPLIESLAASALRVDKRMHPGNYAYRDRIVEILEQAPDAVWDVSQVFNLHVATARRHLANEPPSIDWSLDARREQLELAERHLVDALDYIRPEVEASREPELNLRIALALTYDVRARVEDEDGSESASGFRVKADEQYRLSQRLNVENTYVLENFARHKLGQAKSAPDGPARVRLLVEAIALLQLEREVDRQSLRSDPVTRDLANAFELLQQGRGESWLRQLARDGDEAAAVALARLTLQSSQGDPEAVAGGLVEAEEILKKIPAERATWRSQVLLYEIVSRLSPYDFQRRLEILRQVESDHEFTWPMQLRFEFAILLYQVGDPARRKAGKTAFDRFRDDLRERYSDVRPPAELEYLADPATGLRTRLRTWIKVKNRTVGKRHFGIPDGWGDLDVSFQPKLFPTDRIGRVMELDCEIRFTNFGPEAVPIGRGAES